MFFMIKRWILFSSDPLEVKETFNLSISKLFSEMIAVWIIYTWEIFGKPKNFNIIELGPGDGDLIKVPQSL